MELSEQEIEKLSALVHALDAKSPRTWDMVGVGVWACRPPIVTRAELHLHRETKRRVLFAAYGTGGPRPGTGVDLLLTRNVRAPEEYEGSYSGGGADVKLRGKGYGTGFATALPPGRGRPWGVSIGLSSPGPTVWFCTYRIVGEW